MAPTSTTQTAFELGGQVVTIRGTEYYVRTAFPSGSGMATATLYRLSDMAEMSGKVSLAVDARPATYAEHTKVTELEAHLSAFTVGTLVKIKNPKNAAERSALYAVITLSEKTVSVARLGGDGGRYLRITRSALAIVDPAEVLK